MYEQEEKITVAENNFSDNHVDFYTSELPNNSKRTPLFTQYPENQEYKEKEKKDYLECCQYRKT